MPGHVQEHAHKESTRELAPHESTAHSDSPLVVELRHYTAWRTCIEVDRYIALEEQESIRCASKRRDMNNVL